MNSRFHIRFALDYKEKPRAGVYSSQDLGHSCGASWVLRFYPNGRNGKVGIELIRDHGKEEVLLDGLIYIYYYAQDRNKWVAKEFFSTVIGEDRNSLYLTFNRKFDDCKEDDHIKLNVEVNGFVCICPWPLDEASNDLKPEQTTMYNPKGGDLFVDKGSLSLSQLYSQENLMCTQNVDSSDDGHLAKNLKSPKVTRRSNKTTACDAVAAFDEAIAMPIRCRKTICGTSNNSSNGTARDSEQQHETQTCKIIPSKPLGIDPNSSAGVQDNKVNRNLQDLSNDYLTMLETGKFSDVTLVCGQETFRVHKNILTARCSVFDKKFQESQDTNLEISDVDPDALRIMLAFLYGGIMREMTDLLACRVLIASNIYKLNSLMDMCVSYLKGSMSPGNVLDVLVAAEKCNSSLKDHAMGYVIDNYESLKDKEQWKLFKNAEKALAIDILSLKIDKISG